MDKTIYNTYIQVESQEQADRLKQMCIDYDLLIWNDDISFEVTDLGNEKSFFIYDTSEMDFFIVDLLKDETPIGIQVTESEFINLLNEMK